MKILFIVTTFPALSQTFITNQITGLIDRGCEVDILANIRGNQTKIHSDDYKYKLLDNTYYYSEIVKKIPKNIPQRLKDSSFLIKKYFLKRPKSVLKSLNVFKHGKGAITLKEFYRSISFIDKGPYDIVHCHFGPNGILAAYLRDIGAIEGKIIIAFHGYDLSSYIQQKGNNAYDGLFKKGDLFMPVSFLWEKKLRSLGCSRKKIIVHKMGIDFGKFRFKRKIENIKEQLKLISVARLVEKKGLNYSIIAVAKALEEVKNITYNIIGDGELKDQYKDLIIKLNAEGKIKLLGWKNNGEVIKHLRRSDILLAPSITSQKGDQEGIPVVIMEAMALGLAVISTKHSGIPELVEDGKSGFLVNEKSAEELKSKIKYFWDNPKRIYEMGNEGRNIVEKNHDKDLLNEELYSIYKNLIQR